MSFTFSDRLACCASHRNSGAPRLNSSPLAVAEAAEVPDGIPFRVAAEVLAESSSAISRWNQARRTRSSSAPAVMAVGWISRATTAVTPALAASSRFLAVVAAEPVATPRESPSTGQVGREVLAEAGRPGEVKQALPSWTEPTAILVDKAGNLTSPPAAGEPGGRGKTSSGVRVSLGTGDREYP